MVLADLFEDLTRRAVYVDVASKLRNCKSLLHFVRTEVAHSFLKEPLVVEDSLFNLRLSLAEIKQDLLVAARNLNRLYVEDWAGRVDKAERVELDQQIIYEQSKFVPSVQRSPTGCWMRLTLPKPIDEERLRQVAAQYGIAVELQNRHQIIVRGERRRVKRMAQDIYASLTEPAGE